ncbi:MAG: hypothetical protein ABI548_26375 [Polyangiaceae bacterium]
MFRDQSASGRAFRATSASIPGISITWYLLSILAVGGQACGARSALELVDASAGSQAIPAAGGSSGAGGGGMTSGGAGRGNIVTSGGGNSTGGGSSGGARGIVACPSPGSPDEAYDAISGSPCAGTDELSCRGSDFCSRICNCYPPPNNRCESSAVPVWECDSVMICRRPVACPFDGAVEIAYNAISGSPCATEGADCGNCACELGNGALTWACARRGCD